MALTPKDTQDGNAKDEGTEKLPADGSAKASTKEQKKAAKEAEKKAATKSAQDDAMLREVDEAVRQDELANFGKRYGRPILALIVVGLIGFGGYLWWDSAQEEKREKDSEQIIAAEDKLQAGDTAGGQENLAPVLENGHSDGARTTAKMLQAGAKVEEGKPEQAAKLFAEVAGDSGAPQEMRDLARIREVSLRFDTMKPADVEQRLKPYAVPGNAYFGSAGELVAMAMLEQGKNKEAGVLFGEIAKNEDVPQSIRSRARQMAGLLGVDSITDVDKLIEEQMAGSPPPQTAAQ